MYVGGYIFFRRQSRLRKKILRVLLYTRKRMRGHDRRRMTNVAERWSTADNVQWSVMVSGGQSSIGQQHSGQLDIRRTVAVGCYAITDMLRAAVDLICVLRAPTYDEEYAIASCSTAVQTQCILQCLCKHKYTPIFCNHNFYNT